jgi:hypothetical protein
MPALILIWSGVGGLWSSQLLPTEIVESNGHT